MKRVFILFIMLTLVCTVAISDKHECVSIDNIVGSENIICTNLDTHKQTLFINSSKTYKVYRIDEMDDITNDSIHFGNLVYFTKENIKFYTTDSILNLIVK